MQRTKRYTQSASAAPRRSSSAQERVLITPGRATGNDALLVAPPTGGITGEVSHLGSNTALAAARPDPDGGEACFGTAHLCALIMGPAEIDEIVMRAFGLRRTALIANGGATVLAGRTGEQHLL